MINSSELATLVVSSHYAALYPQHPELAPIRVAPGIVRSLVPPKKIPAFLGNIEVINTADRVATQCLGASLMSLPPAIITKGVLVGMSITGPLAGASSAAIGVAQAVPVCMTVPALSLMCGAIVLLRSAKQTHEELANGLSVAQRELLSDLSVELAGERTPLIVKVSNDIQETTL